MMRRTKIVATLGPATDDEASIEELLRAGADVVRLNFSHGTEADHAAKAEVVRKVAKRLNYSIGILADLQGPKIRIDKFIDGKISLNSGDKFILDADLAADAGTQERVGITYKELPKDVTAGDELVLDDGRVVVTVDAVQGNEIHTTVVNDCELSDNKGINMRGGGLSAAALTEKDKRDIISAANIDVDFLALSFPRCAGDVHQARALMKQAGGDAAIISKIERAEAVNEENMDPIIEASDVIMVARGDLGVEVGDARLPKFQKQLIKRARSLNRIVITATQMMETMIDNQIPTRAEVFDVANAVLDGTDAVMLSAETAVGRHPALVVKHMAEICREAEASRDMQQSKHRVGEAFRLTDEAIALSAMYAANHMQMAAIGSLTESGNTARWMSRISSGIPIFALTTHPKTCRRVILYRGVYPILLHEFIVDPNMANEIAVERLLESKAVSLGDRVIVTQGDTMGEGGGTNQMKILTAGQHYNVS